MKNQFNFLFEKRWSVLYILALFSIFCFGLFLLRVIIFKNFYFLFLVFNLALGWIPIFLAIWAKFWSDLRSDLLFQKKSKNVTRSDRRSAPQFGISSVKWLTTKPLKVLLISFIWLLFFPNAPYLITDIVHLNLNNYSKTVLYFHDQITFFSFATVSLICGFYSLFQMQKVWKNTFSNNISHFFTAIAITLSGFGIYMGRIERFNSWDFFLRPIHIGKFIFHAISSKSAWLISIEFSIFLGLIYLLMVSVKSPSAEVSVSEGLLGKNQKISRQIPK